LSLRASLCCTSQRREAQDAELAQLRPRLAAEFDAGGKCGAAAAVSAGEALGAELQEAKLRCAELAEEAGAARAEAAELGSALAAARAVAVAAHAEAAEAKGLVLTQHEEQHVTGHASHGLHAWNSGSSGEESCGAGAGRLAELEGDDRQLAAQLATLQAAAGRQVQAAAGVGTQLEDLQQVKRGPLLACF
jgi:hypothetical protein